MKIGFKYAFKGIKLLWRSEKNFRIHTLLFGVLVSLSFYLNISKIEWLIILTLSAIVFATEALNSSIEKICDKIEPNKSDDIAWIKDVAAAAVFISALFSFTCALIIFLPYLIELYTTFDL